MISFQVALQTAQGMLESGELPDAAAANVEIVRMIGVRVIRGKLSRDVRKSLNDAVKAKRLGHMKADGHLPEVYFHPNSAWNAVDIRRKIAREAVESVGKVFARRDAERDFSQLVQNGSE
jgi:hypothetical protein